MKGYINCTSAHVRRGAARSYHARMTSSPPSPEASGSDADADRLAASSPTTPAAELARIAAARPGNKLGDIAHAIGRLARDAGYGLMADHGGHGIGRAFHCEPQVLHYGRRGQGLALQPGMIFTVEPMINQGKRHLRILADGWTVVTKDRSLSAQWEHEVLVTETGYEILTISPRTVRP